MSSSVGRFATVGLLTAVIYNSTLLAAVPLLGPLAGSVLAFGLALPFTYLGQRRYTFRSRNRPQQELPWFAALVAVSLPSTTLALYLLRGLPLGVAVVSVNLVAAALSYSFMRLRVFAQR